jgi:hypothetical protein
MNKFNYKVAVTVFAFQIFSALFIYTDVKAQTINNPLPLKLGATSEFSLDRDERSFYKISLPAGSFKIVLDTRRENERGSNLQSNLSVLDQNGAPVASNVINFNQIDVDYRKVHSVSLKTPKTYIFKISSDQNDTKFWLTVLKNTDATPFPFFGNIVPTPILLNETKTGSLEMGESVYYLMPLKKGNYKAVLDFANAEGKNTNIQGYLALLNADGGNQEQLIVMNEIDVAFRRVGSFMLKNDVTHIVRIKNDNYPINYTLKIIPAE